MTENTGLRIIICIDAFVITMYAFAIWLRGDSTAVWTVVIAVLMAIQIVDVLRPKRRKKRADSPNGQPTP